MNVSLSSENFHRYSLHHIGGFIVGQVCECGRNELPKCIVLVVFLVNTGLIVFVWRGGRGGKRIVMDDLHGRRGAMWFINGTGWPLVWGWGTYFAVVSLAPGISEVLFVRSLFSGITPSNLQVQVHGIFIQNLNCLDHIWVRVVFILNVITAWIVPASQFWHFGQFLKSFSGVVVGRSMLVGFFCLLDLFQHFIGTSLFDVTIEEQ